MCIKVHDSFSIVEPNVLLELRKDEDAVLGVEVT
jgi:hypothetical protein